MTTKSDGGKPAAPVEMSNAIKPWRKDAPWWVQAIEALVALGLGIYVLAQSAEAARWLTMNWSRCGHAWANARHVTRY